MDRRSLHRRRCVLQPGTHAREDGKDVCKMVSKVLINREWVRMLTCFPGSSLFTMISTTSFLLRTKELVFEPYTIGLVAFEPVERAV